MKKILFADDDALVARIYRDKLAAAGFHVVVAEDGVLAMKQLIEFKPDLVVLDLLMPRMSGADVLKFIRERPELRSTRVIVFSNSFLAALGERAGALKVEGVLPKSSATPSGLIELIHRIFAEAPLPAPASETKPAQRSAAPAKPTPPRKNEPGPAQSAEKKDEKDEQFPTRVQKEFVEQLPGVLTDIRRLTRGLLETPDLKLEKQLAVELSRKVGFLAQMASMARCAELALLANALEMFLFHLHEKQAPIEDSYRNTIATTVAFLTQHLEKFDPALAQTHAPASVLVVDDDLVTSRGIVHALTHANLRSGTATTPEDALEKLRQTAFDLIVMDVELPGMHGMALCEKIRELELHRRTPVIFITSHTDLKIRARSILSGGDDFISKPILPIELTVKVITQVLKSRAG